MAAAENMPNIDLTTSGYCQTLGNSQSSGGGGGDYNRHYHHQVELSASLKIVSDYFQQDKKQYHYHHQVEKCQHLKIVPDYL